MTNLRIIPLNMGKRRVTIYEGGRQMNKKRKRLTLLAVLFACVFLPLALFISVFDVFSWQMLDKTLLASLAQTTSLYDRNGDLLSEVRGTENRTLVRLDDIPKHTQLAFLAAEDLRFYSHPGIDVYRILGAIKNNILRGSFAEGASTITQQLAKLTHLSTEKTLRRKLEEIHLALQIEKEYSKDEILEMYLNTVYFGRGAYGIQSAARAYFDCDTSELTLTQSAALAAIIKAPSNYAPHIDPQLNKNRRTYILGVMLENDFIDRTAYDEAMKESLWVIAEQEDKEVYSWYIDEVLRSAQELLNLSADEIISGGLKIYTAFDPELQRAADSTYQNTSLFPANASDGTPAQSAMAVIDVQNGAIRALIGGRDYSVRRGLNRATQMRRQPGSALKPLAVYGPALELGYTTSSVLLDEKTSFSGGYTPQNAGDKYYGRVTMRTAIRNSLNTTAVRLLEEIGIDASVRYLKQMGIPVEESDRNLSLALGSMTHGVTPVELAASYAPFANGGTYYEPYCIERIEDQNGTLLYERQVQGKRVISAQNAYLMTSLLQSVITNGTGTRMQAANMPLAGKTGTVSMNGGNRDIWMAAYNPDISVTVWMGFDQTDAAHKIPNGITGGKNTASLCAAFFKEAYAGKKKPGFTQPEGLVWLTIDQQAIAARGSVMLASSTTPQSAKLSEVFTTSNRPYAVSDVWNAPATPTSFSIGHDESGYPLLRFKAADSARYRIQRDSSEESVILTELLGGSGETMTYSDLSAKPGVVYTYRIIPIHEELLKQGVWLEGKQAVQLAQVAKTNDGGLFSSLREWFPVFKSSE